MNSIEHAIELALKRELAAYKFYSQMSQHFAAHAKVQEAFSFLKREEEKHFHSLLHRFRALKKNYRISSEKLRERYEKTLTPLIDLKIENLDPLEWSSVKEVLDHAIEDEKKSAEFYKTYGLNFPEGEAKILFLELVKEECEHQKTLEAVKRLVESKLIDLKDLK